MAIVATFRDAELRLWRVHLWNHTIPELFWPGAVLPGLTFALLYAWPFIEARVTHDRADHQLLDRPRDRPGRTAIGTGVLTFYIVLFAAGSQDIFAQHLDAPIAGVDRTFRILLFIAPVVVALITWKWCHDLAARPPDDDVEATATPISPRPSGVSQSAAEASERPSILARAGLVLGVVAVAVEAFRSRRT